MSEVSVRKTNIYGKTIYAVIAECAVILSSFVVFSSRFDLHSYRGLALIFVFGYPIVISICSGIVAASMAGTKNLVGWKWAGVASVMTLILFIVIATLPSIVSSLAFIIAPVVAVAICFNMMNTTETDTQQ